MAYQYNAYQPQYYAPQYPSYMPRYDQQVYAAQTPQNAAQATQQQNNVPVATMQPAGFQCRPVTSKEEALGVQVDYLSAGTIMPDLGHGMMYLKRFDSNTGLSNMFEFALVQPQDINTQENAVPTNPTYDEIMRTFSEKLESVSDRIDVLFEKLEQWKSRPTPKRGGSEE